MSWRRAHTAPLQVRREGDVWRWSVRLPESDVGRPALRGSVAHATWQEARHAATTAFPGLAAHVDHGPRLTRLARWCGQHLIALALLVTVAVAAASRLSSRAED